MRSGYCRSLRSIVSGLAFVTVIGCGRSGASDIKTGTWGSVPAVVDESKRPLPPPWRHAISLELGSGSEEDDDILRSPIAVTVLTNGAIVVGDDRPLQLRIYDARGIHLASFGRPGGGPGDLTPSHFGWVLRPTGERSFELWSGWPPRIQEWTDTGELLHVETVQDGHPILRGSNPRSIGFTGVGLAWVTATYRRDREGRDIETSYILAGDVQGTTADTLVSIEHEPMPNAYQAVLQFGLEYADHVKDQLLITRANRCFVTSWLEDWVVAIDMNRGIPLSRFRWVHQPDSIQQLVNDRFLRASSESDRAVFSEGLAWLEARVSILGLAEGPDGQILVQRTGRPVDDQWPTDVFSAEGTYLGRVMLPIEPRTSVVRGRKLVGIGTRQGTPVVRVLDITG
jgi:hypothetical protein